MGSSGLGCTLSLTHAGPLCLTQIGASVKDIYHERAWLDKDAMSVVIK
jgi:hypothetical protein